jgi:hypothetical protein
MPVSLEKTVRFLASTDSNNAFIFVYGAATFKAAQ